MVSDDPKSTVARISSMLRGWCGYRFETRGRSITIYDLIHRYTPSDESVAGCYGDPGRKRHRVRARSRTSISMRRSASTPFPGESAATCQERRFDSGDGEKSRMREIRARPVVCPAEGWHVQQEKGLPGQEFRSPVVWIAGWRGKPRLSGSLSTTSPSGRRRRHRAVTTSERKVASKVRSP